MEKNNHPNPLKMDGQEKNMFKTRKNGGFKLVNFVIDLSITFLRVLFDVFTVIRANLSLFFGTALFIIGLLNFESDKYCDGNMADYLSCTRPTAYYYYNNLDIALVVIGAFLVMVWFLKKKSQK